MSYAELHCLSNFSFQRGASHAKELVERAKTEGYAALAITDECSLAGIVRAHDAAEEAGLKLLVGSEFRLDDGLHLVLLAPDHDAYSELCRLITRGRRKAGKGRYRLLRSDFEQGLAHCLAIWTPGPAIADADAHWLREHFPDRGWIGITQLLQADDAERMAALLSLGRETGLPCVATGGVHYHVRERRRLHDVMTSIRIGCSVADAGHALFPNGERHLRPLATLRRLYPPELLAETLRIAERCTFRLTELRYRYPHEVVPEGRTPIDHLRQLVQEGSARRWPGGMLQKVTDQLEQELQLIEELQYEHYFLTVADIVRWAREQGILCQGRGSAANSAVCFALHVTEMDPAISNLLFGRFLSRERGEPPDIDVDFEHQRREEVMQYVYRRYGRERAALAATVIRYQPRSALRDVGRALGFSPDHIDALAKSMYWFDDAAQMAERFRQLGLDPEAPMSRMLIGFVQELLEFPRHLSQHVGGFVISEAPLHTLVPVENAAMADRTIIQWDKDDLESLKLLKVDCLALGMLSAIRRCFDLLKPNPAARQRMQDIPDDDGPTYDMLGKADSVGVFQVESRAQMSMLPRLKPRCHYDLTIQVAIVRPGPIQGDMVHPYLRRRSGKEAVDYPSEALEKVLGRTEGVPLFQEQVMEIAMVAADFTPGEADNLRRSMAAWKRRGGLEHLRDKLIGGMLKNGYKEEFAERIYQQILGFGDYGFPESHAAGFAKLAYVSAWLKCHHPAAFCAALINSWPMGFYAPAQLMADARRHGVEFLPADVMHSDWDCSLDPPDAEKPAVRLGLRMVSGFAEAEGLALMQARRERPFASVDDLAHRLKLSRKMLDALACADALATLGGHRHRARWATLGNERLPGLLAGHSAEEDAVELREPTEGQDIMADYRSTGLTLRRHPLAVLRPRLDRLRVRRAAELPTLRNGQTVRVAGIVTHRQRPGTASGVIFMSIEDETGTANLIVWPRVQEELRHEIIGSTLIVVSGELQTADGVTNVVMAKARDYSDWLGGMRMESRDFH
ncbi:error-prone DNA polymerase [Solimonas sp. K1W22B-7]|uniref:error-prone DNA polymerase n=1 Tax=Solimonas sp. K1W22B-7 TaxID=2303331 RepID=UPI000E32D618|nr:error-prone DNA polymerase [Solimonas sp. K1W22B-7]AXQ28908.1 error-prone DNA polymerase [Solimonas sp. K1W22B-7]